jgi:putative addiction module component (TIGR02574 family)
MSAAAINITNVLKQVLSLPLPGRSYIAERLIVSLDDNGELSPAWRAELDARVKRRESGETRSHSLEEVHQEIEAILA